MPRSTPWWLAAGKALVDFFGGELDYNDCDSSDSDYAVPAKGDSMNRPSDGKPWHRLQDRILALQPLSADDILSARQDAAYKEV